MVVGCAVPNSDIFTFTYHGPILRNGRIPGDHYITVSCPDGKYFNSSCLAVSDESSDGRWTPALSCPSVTGMCCHSMSQCVTGVTAI